MSRLLLAPAAIVILSASALAAEPAASSLGGPQVAGICLLSQQAVLANAKVSLAADARLRQLTSQAQVEVDNGRKPIDVDARALEAQRASLKPAEFQQRQQALATRVQALQQIATQRSREIEATRQKVLARLTTAAQPVIAQVYKARGCGLLVDRNAVLGGNMGGDITKAVVDGLDARLTQMNFERETLPLRTASAKAAQ